jgi:hypothetical protein
MLAVFFSIEEEETIKQDVMFIAVIRNFPDTDSDDFVRPFVATREGDFIDPSWMDGFLGIEYDSVKQNWDEEIREVIKEGEKKSPRLVS